MTKEDMDYIQKQIAIRLPVFQVVSVTPAMKRCGIEKNDAFVGLHGHKNVFHSVKRNENYSLPVRSLKFVWYAHYSDPVWFSNSRSWVVCAKTVDK